MLGLVLTIFFGSSFTTALQRVYFHAWRRPRRGGAAVYWRGLVCLVAVLAAMALLGGLGDDLDGGLQVGLFAIAALAATSGVWWFSAWFLLLGEVRPVLPTGVITAWRRPYAVATIWMPEVVTRTPVRRVRAHCILVPAPSGLPGLGGAPRRTRTLGVPAHRCRHPPTS